MQNKDESFTPRKFLVVDTTQHILLSWTKCVNMKLLRLDESINAVLSSDTNDSTPPPDNQNNDLVTEFAPIFTGLGQSASEYRIELEADCPRSTAINER